MTQFKHRAILLLSGVALMMSACGSDPKDATEANFEAALNAHFSKMKECFKVGKEPNENGIIQSFRSDGKGFGADKRDFFDDLTAAGLLATVSFNKEEKTFSGTGKQMVTYVGFKISSEGEKYLRPDELDKGFYRTGTPQLCYGTPQVVDIINFTEPADAMGVKASNVQFTYEVVDVAPWATNPAIVKQFKWLPERLANQAIEGDEDLVLTNDGWVHHSVLKN
jgi:hypothetical protein